MAKKQVIYHNHCEFDDHYFASKISGQNICEDCLKELKQKKAFSLDTHVLKMVLTELKENMELNVDFDSSFQELQIKVSLNFISKNENIDSFSITSGRVGINMEQFK